jgi:hypothetical protein
MVSNTERIDRLERELAELKGTPSVGIARRQYSEEPSPRFDPTAQLRVPDNVAREMAAAVPTSMVRAVVGDHFGKSTSLPTVHGRSPAKPNPNFAPERPLRVFGTEKLGRKETRS